MSNKYSDKELKKILEEHQAWLINNEKGKRANLYGANLGSADLRSANLYCADLRSANLYCANLYGANLRSANLGGANLGGMDISKFQIVPEVGGFTAFKKLKEGVAELYIPRSAKRVGGLLGRKCRVSKVKVKSITDSSGKQIEVGFDKHSGTLEYRVGKWVKPDKFDEDVRVECTNGIHIFITRKEAEEY